MSPLVSTAGLDGAWYHPTGSDFQAFLAWQHLPMPGLQWQRGRSETQDVQQHLQHMTNKQTAPYRSVAVLQTTCRGAAACHRSVVALRHTSTMPAEAVRHERDEMASALSSLRQDVHNRLGSAQRWHDEAHTLLRGAQEQALVRRAGGISTLLWSSTCCVLRCALLPSWLPLSPAAESHR